MTKNIVNNLILIRSYHDTYKKEKDLIVIIPYRRSNKEKRVHLVGMGNMQIFLPEHAKSFIFCSGQIDKIVYFVWSEYLTH